MPELPEVQTVVNDLNKKIKGRVIADVWTDNPKHIKDHKNPGQRYLDTELGQAKRNFARFKKTLIGKKVLKSERQGKNALICLSSNKLLLIHQKMTGHLLFGKWKIEKGKAKALSPEAVVSDPFNGFIHLIISFKDGSQLALSDMRKFAKMILAEVEEIKATPDLKNLGPDALSAGLTLKKFSQLIKNSGPTIKQALLKPELIAGIGNIYADESLFRAKLHPRQSPKKLTEAEIKRLYRAIRQILRKAVKLRGTSTSDFRDTAGKEGDYTNERLIYQRHKEKCPRCQEGVKRITVGGRGSHYCPNCQKPRRLYKAKK